MTESQLHQASLHVDQTDPDVIVLYNTAPPTGLPGMTVTLAVGIDIEIDPSSPLPSSITLSHISKATWDGLSTILAPSATAELRAIIEHHQSNQSPVVQFAAGPDWMAVLELGQLLWDLHWNPLPHDKALLALDLIRAQRRTQHLTKNPPNPAFIPLALPAVIELKEQQAHDRLDQETELLLTQSLEAAPELNQPAPDMVRHLNPALTPDEISYTLTARPLGPGVLLAGTPDWRLTGHGPAMTSAHSIQVTPHGKVPGAVTITVPAKPGAGTATTPSYQAFITTQNDQLLATTTLHYEAVSNQYIGHTHTRAMPSPKDNVHLRHNGNIATPNNRTHEHLQAIASRYLSGQPTHSPLTKWHSSQSPEPAALDWFLFELTSSPIPTGETNRGMSTEEANRGLGTSETALEYEFKAGGLKRTRITAEFGLSSDGDHVLSLTVRSYPQSGDKFCLDVSLAHPDGAVTVHTTDTQIARKSTMAFKIFGVSPNARPATVTLRVVP